MNGFRFISLAIICEPCSQKHLQCKLTSDQFLRGWVCILLRGRGFFCLHFAFKVQRSKINCSTVHFNTLTTLIATQNEFSFWNNWRTWLLGQELNNSAFQTFFGKCGIWTHATQHILWKCSSVSSADNNARISLSWTISNLNYSLI